MNKKLISGIVIVIVVVVGIAYFNSFVAKPICWPYCENMTDQDREKIKESATADWKTYTNSIDGYSFDYPSKLSISSNNGEVYLSHSIPFDNYDGGCDMKGDSKLSKTLNDFGMSVRVVSGKVTPSYIDGTYSKGELTGNWAYKGAEGCGNTEYYFPITNNRTLIITKQEIQILSPVVSAEVRDKVLAVPGVISYNESKEIVEKILSTLKFTN